MQKMLYPILIHVKAKIVCLNIRFSKNDRFLWGQNTLSSFQKLEDVGLKKHFAI